MTLDQSRTVRSRSDYKKNGLTNGELISGTSFTSAGQNIVFGLLGVLYLFFWTTHLIKATNGENSLRRDLDSDAVSYDHLVGFFSDKTMLNARESAVFDGDTWLIGLDWSKK